MINLRENSKLKGRNRKKYWDFGLEKSYLQCSSDLVMTSQAGPPISVVPTNHIYDPRYGSLASDRRRHDIDLCHARLPGCFLIFGELFSSSIHPHLQP